MLELRSVNVDYPMGKGRLRAVAGADALFPEGEISAIVGPSGAGKTSLIQAMAGLLKPSGGSIIIDGRPLETVRPDTSVIFQDYGLLPWKTVRSNVELPLLLRGVHKAERRNRSITIINEMGLAAFAGFYPSRLSGGMRQRVAIARALVSEPDILLMDEPFSSLDAITREGMQQLLLDLMRHRRLTCIIVTHSIEEAAFLADRVYIMRGHAPGRLEEPIVYSGSRDRDSAFRNSSAYFERCRDLRAALDGDAPSKSPLSSSLSIAPARLDSVPDSSAADLQTQEAATEIQNLPLKQPSTAHSRGSPSNVIAAALNSKFTRGFCAFIIVIILWDILACLLGKPFLPAPALAFSAFSARIRDGSLLLHLGASARRIGTALIFTALPAIALGFAAGRSKKADAFISPFVYLFHPLPKVAFLPVIMLLFGLGDLAKDILIGLIIFGQILVAARDSAKAVEPRLVESVRSLGAGSAAVLLHVVFPSSLPALLTALRVGLGTAIAILFLAETFATETGLGYFVMDAWARVDYPDMYAAIIALSAFGLLVYALIDFAEDHLCVWRRKD